MTVGDRVWNLTPMVGLWVPAGVEHGFVAVDRLLLFDAKYEPSLCPIVWSMPTLIALTPVVGVLLEHLATDRLASGERERAVDVLYDNLRPVGVAGRGVVLPVDGRARRVAVALVRRPSDDRSIDEWAGSVHTSRKTLGRLFREDTGLSFSEWRTTVRLQHAAALLVAGEPVGRTARAVGFRDASSFIVAFRRLFGVTPGDFADTSAATDWKGVMRFDQD